MRKSRILLFLCLFFLVAGLSSLAGHTGNPITASVIIVEGQLTPQSCQSNSWYNITAQAYVHCTQCENDVSGYTYAVATPGGDTYQTVVCPEPDPLEPYWDPCRGGFYLNSATPCMWYWGYVTVDGGSWCYDTQNYSAQYYVCCCDENGAACSSNETCCSDNCVDGVCCDTACDGDCEACNLPETVGTCTSEGYATYRKGFGDGNSGYGDDYYGDIAWADRYMLCCDGAKDNINGYGSCIPSYSTYSGAAVDASPYHAGDMYSVPWASGVTADGWAECDYYANSYCSGVCHGVFTLAGEGGIGGYPAGSADGGRSDMGGNAYGYAECCGDDYGEYYRCNSSGYCLCCDNQNDVVGINACFDSCSSCAPPSDGYRDRDAACSSPDYSTNGGRYVCETCLGKTHSYSMTGTPQWDTGTVLSCCGDDAGEYFNLMHSANATYDWGDWNREGPRCEFLDGYNPADTSCCSLPSDCVYKGKCYASATSETCTGGLGGTYNATRGQSARCAYDVTGDGRRDGLCYGLFDNNIWFDCDTNEFDCETNCQYNWSADGENISFGEYNNGDDKSDGFECCGDDTREFFICNLDLPYICRCCNNVTDVVDSAGVCHDGVENRSVGDTCYDLIDNDGDVLVAGIDWDSQVWSRGVPDGFPHIGRHGDDGCDVGVTNIGVEGGAC